MARSGHRWQYDSGVDQQAIRFTSANGRRIAYATSGEGPPLVLGGWWMSHLELDWREPHLRAFVQALGKYRTVVRYDRPGTGLSADGEDPPTTLAEEAANMAAVVDAVGGEPVDAFAVSCGGPVAAAVAAEQPERIRNLVLFGAYANGADVAPPEVRDQLIGLVRKHWGLGSRVLSDVFLPTASGEDRDAFTAYQRESASAEVAAKSLEIVYAVDVRDRLEAVATPTVVVHRRGDRAIRFPLGRSLAASIPESTFIALEGLDHLPWRGAAREAADTLLRAIGIEEPELGELAGDPPAPEPAETDLSARELEVLRLVALGLSDREIAEELVLSPHTVHRHVANIRTKLRLPSRAAAAAQAARLGLL
jgi:pimeloyl-ACP methyl ester carboxylesterase/DNA-binding CsgD family transcriptional regulator